MVSGQQSPAAPFDPIIARGILQRNRIAKLRTQVEVTTTTTGTISQKTANNNGSPGYGPNRSMGGTMHYSAGDPVGYRKEDAQSKALDAEARALRKEADQKRNEHRAVEKESAKLRKEPESEQRNKQLEENEKKSQQLRDSAQQLDRQAAAKNREAQDSLAIYPSPTAEKNHVGPDMPPPLEGKRPTSFPSTQDPARERAQSRAEAAERQLGPDARERARMQRERIKQGTGAPIQLPPTPAMTPEEDPTSRKAADRASDDGATLRMRQMAAKRAQKKAALAAEARRKATEGGEHMLAERGVQGVYSILFNGAAAADESAPVDGGLTAAAAVTADMWRVLLTIFPAFNDTIRATFIGQWLPQKYDLADEAGLGMLYQGYQWLDFVWALTVAGLLFIVVNLVIILLAALFAMLMNPAEGIIAFMSFF